MAIPPETVSGTGLAGLNTDGYARSAVAGAGLTPVGSGARLAQDQSFSGAVVHKRTIADSDWVRWQAIRARSMNSSPVALLVRASVTNKLAKRGGTVQGRHRGRGRN